MFRYEVRRARPADLPAVAALRSHGFGRQTAEAVGELEFPGQWTWVAIAHSATASQAATAGQGRPVAVARLRLLDILGGPPAGYYLMGVIVDPEHRGHGLGEQLTRARIDFAGSASACPGQAAALYYFANARNAASIALHTKLGFREIQRPFQFPGVTFEGGVGVLFRLDRPET